MGLQIGAEDSESPETWVVRLRVSLGADDAEALYEIDVEAVGLVKVAPQFQPGKPKLRGNFAVVNGAGLVYGAIREQVAGMTSRSPYGRFMLPTGHFADYLGPDEDNPDRVPLISTEPSE